MSEEVAHSLGESVASNIRMWRKRRHLDQQALADRLTELGWSVDRTTVTRIETQSRKVTVDDLGLLAVALNVPLTLLLLPVHGETFGNVTLTPAQPTSAVYPWLVWEWMLGNEPLPGRMSPFGEEWQSGASSLRLYERVQIAQQRLHEIEREVWTKSVSIDDEQEDAERRFNESLISSADYRDALQELVDTTSAMEDAEMPADGLLGTYERHVRQLRVTRSAAPRRQRLVEQEDEQ